MNGITQSAEDGKADWPRRKAPEAGVCRNSGAVDVLCLAKTESATANLVPLAVFRQTSALTLTELLVTMAVIALLAGLLLPALSKAKASARRTQCINNLRQVSHAVLMYADDHGQALPSRASQNPGVHGAFWFKSLTRSYVGLKGPSSPADRLYACPADRFFFNRSERLGSVPFVRSGLHTHQFSDYSSYMFNCGNLITDEARRFPGVGGWTVPQVVTPTRTVLVAEFPAFLPFSWHQPRRMDGRNYPFSNAQCVSSFVDGHVSVMKFFFDASLAAGVEAWQYDPPGEYAYRWSAD